MKPYYGDVEVTVRMRYRLSAEFSAQKPSKAEVLEVLQNDSYDDIADDERLEVLSVDKVGKNVDPGDNDEP